MRLFYFTASNKDAQAHLNTTIRNEFPMHKYKHLLSDETKQLLIDNNKDDFVKMWGATPGPSNKSNWRKIENGDRLLVYSKKEFLYYGRVFGKTNNEELAKEAWGTDNNGETWEYIYFIDNLKPLNVMIKEFNKFVGYSPNFFPQGFSFVKDNIVNFLIHEFGSIDKAINFLSESKNILSNFNNNIDKYGEQEIEKGINEMTEEEFENHLEDLDSEASYDVKKRMVKIRKYNNNVIDDLKEKYNYRCQICGKETKDVYGVSVVEAHHIEHFSLTQNNDPDNIMILCPNHHRLIHKAKGEFKRKEDLIVYNNGFEEYLKINYHL